MPRFDCRCPEPGVDPVHPNPSKRDTCRKCSGYLNPAWDSTDANLAAFFDRLQEATPNTRTWLAEFREHCEARELAGREQFGHEYLSRDNPIEATEEAADGCLYMYLDSLRAKREGWEDEADVALSAAYFFAQAHRYSRMLRTKRRGDTGPAWDE